MSFEDDLKQVEGDVVKTVEERLYLLEQAFERALGVKLGQFDPNPAVAAAALAPPPDDPSIATALVDETGVNDPVPAPEKAPASASA